MFVIFSPFPFFLMVKSVPFKLKIVLSNKGTVIIYFGSAGEYVYNPMEFNTYHEDISPASSMPQYASFSGPMR